MSIQPGNYRITELALRAKVTRTTVDKWQERYALDKILVEHEGREVAAYVLDNEKITRILKDYPALDNGVDTDQSSSVSLGYHPIVDADNRELSFRLDLMTTQCEDLKLQIEQLKNGLTASQKELSASQMKCSRLEGLLENMNARLADKDAIILAKDQTINAANAAVMLMEQQKQTLEVEVPKQLGRNDALEEKKGWLSKFFNFN